MARKPSLAELAKKFGYEYLGGKSRKFRDVSTGKEISRRKFEQNILGRETVGRASAVSKTTITSPRGKTREVIQRKPMTRYKNLITQYRENWANRHPGQKVPTRNEIRQNPEFKQIVKDLKSKDNSPDGKKAQALVKLGRRQPEWDMPVGESPKTATG